MTGVITDIARYLIIIIMVLYTCLNFYVLRRRDTKWQNSVCRRQIFLIFLFHFLGYLIVFLQTQDWTMVIFYAIQLVFFLAYLLIYSAVYPDSSRVLLSNALMLTAISMLMLTRLDVDKCRKQFLMVVLAALLTLLIPVIIKHMKIISKWAWLYAFVGLGLLFLVWRMGNTNYGAQLSFSFGGITLQPSEFVKLTFVFFTASMFQKGTSFRRVLVTTIIAAAHVLILVASTDLGSGLVYFISFVFMLYVATGKWQYLLGGAGAGAGAALLAYKAFDHVKVRVSIWRDPFADYNVKGYQLAQALFAVSSGGWFGLGLYQGFPDSIPVVTKDFIFAAIGEELGMIFGICLILIYLGFVLQMLWISTWMETLFYKIAGFGLAVMFGVQVFLHIGGTMQMIPMTGITLPLVSYGGSSVFSTMIAIGVIQGMHLMREKEVRNSGQNGYGPSGARPSGGRPPEYRETGRRQAGYRQTGPGRPADRQDRTRFR